MTLQLRAKPPQIGNKITINGCTYKVCDVRRLIGYKGRFMVELLRVGKPGGRGK